LHYRIHTGFYLYCTCMQRLHLVDRCCMLALALQFFPQTLSNSPKFFRQICSKVHSPKFFTAKVFFRTVCNKATRFLQHNLRNCSRALKELSYKQFILPVLEYAAAIWDPYHLTDINMIQHRATRLNFVLNRP